MNKLLAFVVLPLMVIAIGFAGHIQEQPALLQSLGIALVGIYLCLFSKNIAEAFQASSSDKRNGKVYPVQINSRSIFRIGVMFLVLSFIVGTYFLFY